MSEDVYSLPERVESLHEGALIILSHWHYYKRGLEPLKTDWKKEKGQSAIWSKLSDLEREHIVQTCLYYRGKATNGNDTKDNSVCDLERN